MFGPDFVWGQVSEAFSGCFVLSVYDGVDLRCGHVRDFCFAGQAPSHATDCIFNTTFLPRAVGVAEVALRARDLVDEMVLCELCSVIISNRTAQAFGQTKQIVAECDAHSFSTLVGLNPCHFHATFALMQDEHDLLVLPERHQVRLPMAEALAACERFGPFIDGDVIRKGF